MLVMEKVIFLDIEGVITTSRSILSNKTSGKDLEAMRFLVSQGWYERIEDTPKRRIRSITSKLMDNLNTLIKDTGAYVVISSNWRSLYSVTHLTSILRSKGFDSVIYDYTPKCAQYRGDEIQEWLNHHPNVSNIVIIDDEPDMVHLKPYLVQTSFDQGLTKDHVRLAKEMLKKEYPPLIY